MRRVAFITDDLGIRGTGSVIWLYAHYNEEMLKNKSIIVVKNSMHHYKDDMNPGLSSQDVQEKWWSWFTDRFEVHMCDEKDIDQKLLDLHIDVCLIECYGNATDYVPLTVPSITHCIFNGELKKGTVNTAISDYLGNKHNMQVLPNIIEVADDDHDLRDALGIPHDAVVFGRYGGFKQFSIPTVKEVIIDIATKCQDIYFIFMNTEPFVGGLSNVKYIEGTRNMVLKRRFINTCDAMIHARIDGETFGCACGEFALGGKYVITCESGDTAHVDNLGKQAIVYKSITDLRNILLSFKNVAQKNVQIHNYWKYKAEHVMPLLDKYINDACKAQTICTKSIESG